MEETTALVEISPQKDPAIIDLLNEVMGIVARANTFLVENEADILLATNDLSNLARLKKVMEDKRKEYLDPLRRYTATINESFKVISEPLLLADTTMRGKVLAYRTEQERKAREAEAIERGKRELEEREAKLKGEPAPVQRPVPVVHLKSSAQAEEGETNVLTNYQWEVVDFAIVPDVYKMPDGAKITKQVRSSKGAIVIAGIRIFPVKSLRVEAAQ